MCVGFGLNHVLFKMVATRVASNINYSFESMMTPAGLVLPYEGSAVNLVAYLRGKLPKIKGMEFAMSGILLTPEGDFVAMSGFRNEKSDMVEDGSYPQENVLLPSGVGDSWAIARPNPTMQAVAETIVIGAFNLCKEPSEILPFLYKTKIVSPAQYQLWKKETLVEKVKHLHATLYPETEENQDAA